VSGFAGIQGAASSFGYNSGYIIESFLGRSIRYNSITGDTTPMLKVLSDYDALDIDLRRSYFTENWPIPIPEGK